MCHLQLWVWGNTGPALVGRRSVARFGTSCDIRGSAEAVVGKRSHMISETAAGATIAPIGGEHRIVGVPRERRARAEKAIDQVDVLTNPEWPEPTHPPVRVGPHPRFAPCTCPCTASRTRYSRL